MTADEVFTTGNYGKVLPITRVEDKAFAVRADLPPGASALLGLRRVRRLSGRPRPSRRITIPRPWRGVVALWQADVVHRRSREGPNR
jgi:hypothetical protein